ncbi:hypothetical protein TNCV_1529731 [Trichonephila clavipes]|uniref:DUF4817 domain-containing protein n=1 Tax=Trichonephila clavipes TaxID=2585209 RepID=A0A8X6SNV6_TRICX|nr:hypothetical protein TNCV_1529731 [Trichonephila clavipes]
MPLIYELAERNAQAAERLYRERYLQKDVPDLRMFANLHHNLCVAVDHQVETGIVRDATHSNGPRYPTHLVPYMEQNALDTVRRNPSTMLGVGITRGPPLLYLLPHDDPYPHKL